MRITRNENGDGYLLALTAAETSAWANRPGERWPCSTLADRTLVVDVDRNGLCEVLLDGHGNAHLDAVELYACVRDHLPADLRHLWPAWEHAAERA